MRPFKVEAPYEPSGDQPEAIAALSKGFLAGDKYQTLKGVTGSGKTFTMAKIIDMLTLCIHAQLKYDFGSIPSERSAPFQSLVRKTNNHFFTLFF